MRKEAEAWLAIAAEELQSAEYLAEKKIFRMVCYHAQQSVEKTLKALLVERDIDIPRTHNILDLNSAAKKLGYDVKLSEEDSVFLNSIYRARYPADLGLTSAGEPTDKDAAKSLLIAKKMAEWSKKGFK
jgi:HEPN domain-containing protein